MGGSMTLGHGMVLSLHLIKLLKSSRKFTNLMTHKYDSVRGITCLEPIHRQLQVQREFKIYLHNTVLL